MRCLLVVALLAAPSLAWSQASPAEVPTEAPEEAPPEVAASPQDAPTEFEPVRVTAPRYLVEDPFALKNARPVEDTVFNRSWREPVSAESIGMQGGIVALAIGYAIDRTGAGIRKLPGWKLQIQHATARPPPLQDEHMQRALRLQQTGGLDDVDQATPNPDAGTLSDDTP